ncbi:SGNH/GDSL hydrolase family protein [Erwinia sp. S38]|uniref:SGNH/GDSL hydrolase family protein n=1 Tax=Erwinia sp. S38 TaxID=2769338 RepID=UPI00190A9976|nr:SGNH/GDSL hydrolase family protein [Erwinia sp. S38]MBK0003356.1 SGNH/GDSL hydrolase family protein [Erwinia sp. S38]
MASFTPPLGSSSPEVLADNASRLDKLLNSQEQSIPDRAGEPLKSWMGIEADSAAKLAELDSVINSVDNGDYTFSTVPLGLAAVTELQFFRVVVPDGGGNTIAWNVYQKVDGVAVYKTSQPNAYYVEQVKGTADAINRRTEGLKTESESAYPLEITDNKGKGILFSESQGRINCPGGVKTPALNADTVTSGVVAAQEMPVNAGDGDAYLLAEVDRAGHVLFATDSQTGKKIYLGEPLHNHRGPLEGDFFAIGDSITAYGVAYSGTNNSGTSYAPCVRDQSWHAWASMMTAGRLRLKGISATGGYTVTQVLNTHVSKAEQAATTFCVVMCGRNDVVQGIDVEAVTIPAFLKIFRRLRQKGIIPVVCTMSAQGNSTSNTQRIAEHKINAWLRAYARKYRLPLADLHRYTVNPLNGDWTPGWNQDVSHPNGFGARAMGRALADGLKEWSAPVYAPRADEQLSPAISNNLLENCLFLDSDGTNPAGWTVTKTGTSAVAASGEIKGNAWSVTGHEAEKTVTLIPSDRLQLGFFAKTGDALFELYLISGTTHLAGIRDWKVSTEGFLYFSYEFTVPAGVTSATLKLKTTTAQASVGQVSLLKITELV